MYKNYERIFDVVVEQPKEVMDDITIDYHNNMLLGFDPSYSYTYNGSEIDVSTGECDIITTNYGGTAVLVKLGNGDTLDSDELSIQIPAKPVITTSISYTSIQLNVPSGSKVNGEVCDGKFDIPTYGSNYYYVLGGTFIVSIDSTDTSFGNYTVVTIDSRLPVVGTSTITNVDEGVLVNGIASASYATSSRMVYISSHWYGNNVVLSGSGSESTKSFPINWLLSIPN